MCDRPTLDRPGASVTAAVLALALAPSCTPAPRDLDWVLVSRGPIAARAAEVCIVEGGCDAGATCEVGALTRYRDELALSGGAVDPTAAMRPPQLPRGRYGFVARARDVSCVVVAEGCTEIDLPADRVEVVLTPPPMPSADCCGDACVDGMCAGGDAGIGCGHGPCTYAVCTAAGACDELPVPEDTPCPDTEGSDDPCLASVCRAGVCAEVMPTNDGGACALDADPCLTAACAAGTCIESVPVTTAEPCASDGNVCTTDVCDTSSGTCVHVPVATPTPCADDGNPCTEDVCAGGTCAHVPAPFAPCEDGNPCTANACDGAGNCAAAPTRDGESCTGDPGWRCCDGGCRNVSADPSHCGGCRQRCAAGRACVVSNGFGTCTCGSTSECPGTGLMGAWDCTGGGFCACLHDRACGFIGPIQCNPAYRRCTYP
jgi:hypothetical protein